MDVRELKDKATQLFSKGKFAKAGEAYDVYCKADPKDLQARLRMGDAWAKAGMKDRAISAYQAAAEGFAKDGFLPRAIAASKLVLELDPAHKGVSQMLADLYARKSGTTRPGIARVLGAKPEPSKPVEPPKPAEPTQTSPADATEIDVEADSPPPAPVSAPLAVPPAPPAEDAVGIEIQLTEGSTTGEVEVPIGLELDPPPAPLDPPPAPSDFEVDPPLAPSSFELDPPPPPNFELDPPPEAAALSADAPGPGVLEAPSYELEVDDAQAAADEPERLAQSQSEGRATPRHLGATGSNVPTAGVTDPIANQVPDPSILARKRPTVGPAAPAMASPAPSSSPASPGAGRVDTTRATAAEGSTGEPLTSPVNTVNKSSSVPGSRPATPVGNSLQARVAIPTTTAAHQITGAQTPTASTSTSSTQGTSSAPGSAAEGLNTAAQDAPAAPSSPSPSSPSPGSAPPGLKSRRPDVPTEPPRASAGARIWLPPNFATASPGASASAASTPRPSTLPGPTGPLTELERSLEAFSHVDSEAPGSRPVVPAPPAPAALTTAGSFTELELEGDSLQAVEAVASQASAPFQSSSSVSISVEEAMDAPDEQKAGDPSALPKIPLFSDLPPDAFIALFESCPLRRAEPGDRLIDQGSMGSSFFVICAGKVRVLRADDGVEREVAVLEEGAFFGEMALLSDAPRSASVEACAEDTQLLEIPAGVLSALSKEHPTVATALKQFCRQRLLSNLMNTAPLFKPFTRSQRRELVQRFRARDAVKGEVLIREGQPADGLYVVLTGEVSVVITQREVARLREGQVFGEMSLLTRSMTTATVATTRRTSYLRLPRADFDELIMSHPQILEQIAELTDERRRQNAELQLRPTATASMV